MTETFSTSEVVEVTLKMHPVPPGTKSTRLKAVNSEGNSNEKTDGSEKKQPPESASETDANK